jgi:hypothetical protein
MVCIVSIVTLFTHHVLFAEKLMLDAIGVFEVVRRFFRYLNLKPFLLEDFLMALQTVGKGKQ